MADRLRFHRNVASDLREAMRWYDEISPHLGQRFRDLANERFDAIADNPEWFPFAFDDVRFARLKRFPYLMLFRERGDHVQVLGVFHSASDPRKWRHRVNSP